MFAHTVLQITPVEKYSTCKIEIYTISLQISPKRAPIFTKCLHEYLGVVHIQPEPILEKDHSHRETKSYGLNWGQNNSQSSISDSLIP